MLNKMTLVAIATITLYGCGGDSSSSASPNKETQAPIDYPIKNSTFTPLASTDLSYTYSVDGRSIGGMTLNFTAIDDDLLVAKLIEEDPFNPITQIIYELANNGVQQFYLSEQFENGIPVEPSMYFAGTDGALHEITDAYLVGPRFVSTVMNSSPLFRLQGSEVKEKDPNIDISVNTVSVDLVFTAEQVRWILSDFDQHIWVQSLPANTLCQTAWTQHISETGVRKQFSVSGKTIEAAYLKESNTYNLRCEDMDSMEFQATTERYFNPTLGLIEQVEHTKVEQTQLREEKATLSSIDKA